MKDVTSGSAITPAFLARTSPKDLVIANPGNVLLRTQILGGPDFMLGLGGATEPGPYMA